MSAGSSGFGRYAYADGVAPVARNGYSLRQTGALTSRTQPMPDSARLRLVERRPEGRGYVRLTFVGPVGRRISILVPEERMSDELLELLARRLGDVA